MGPGPLLARQGPLASSVVGAVAVADPATDGTTHSSFAIGCDLIAGRRRALSGGHSPLPAAPLP